MPTIPSIINPSFALPKLPNLNHAEWMFERIVRSINAFEDKLKSDEEVGARLVSFGGREIIHIEDVGYWGPDLIIFYGSNVDKNQVELLQHITQVSVLLVAVPATDPAAPRRIGFELMQKLKASAEDADGTEEEE